MLGIYPNGSIYENQSNFDRSPKLNLQDVAHTGFTPTQSKEECQASELPSLLNFALCSYSVQAPAVEVSGCDVPYQELPQQMAKGWERHEDLAR